MPGSISRRRFLGLAGRLLACGLVGANISRGQRATAAEVPHWDYLSHGGGEGWGELTEAGSGVLAFPDCNLAQQSPIDIPRGAPLSSGLVLDYRETKLDVLNNGHTIQAGYEPGSTMTVNGKVYGLRQFHFHSPSEHQVHGRTFPLEAHLVHQAADGEYAVVGVLMTVGLANAGFQHILDVMPEDEGTVSSSGSVNAAGFLPQDLSYYAYAGSFTTPPCTEGVLWSVLRETIAVSEDQVSRFQKLPFLNHDGVFAGNARPVQPLNGRLAAPQDATPPGPSRVKPPATGTAGLASR